MAAYVLAGLVAGQSWRHTIIFDDSLNLLWREYTHDAIIDHRHNRSVNKSLRGNAVAKHNINP